VTGIEKFMAAINERFGENTILRASDLPTLGRVSTGSVVLDWGIGGGIAIGRITELYGYESVGKTLVALRIVRNFQEAFPERSVAWVDTEQSWDEEWVRRVGVDPARVWIAKPDTLNQAFDIMDVFARTGDVSLVVLDSLGASAPQEELDVSMVDKKAAGLKARTGNWGMRKLQSALNYSRRMGHESTILVINHTYMGLSGFRPTKETPGGKGKDYADALKVELFVRKELRYPKEIDPNEDQYGQRVGFYVKKSKVGIPHRRGEFEVFIQPYHGYDVGDFSLLEYVPFLVNAGILSRTGAWYTLPDGGRVQGAQAVADWLRGLDSVELDTMRRECLERVAELDVPDEQGDEPEAGDAAGEGAGRDGAAGVGEPADETG